jgi:hypothetical protein
VRHRHHAVTGAEASNAGPDAFNDAGHVIPENARQADASPATVTAVVRIHRVDSRRMDFDPDLTFTWYRIRRIRQVQLLGAAELADDHSLQPSLLPAASRSRKPGAGLAASIAGMDTVLTLRLAAR